MYIGAWKLYTASLVYAIDNDKKCREGANTFTHTPFTTPSHAGIPTFRDSNARQIAVSMDDYKRLAMLMI